MLCVPTMKKTQKTGLTALTNGSISLSEPNIGATAWDYVKECLDTGWVSSAGPYVETFEKKSALLPAQSTP